AGHPAVARPGPRARVGPRRPIGAGRDGRRPLDRPRPAADERRSRRAAGRRQGGPGVADRPQRARGLTIRPAATFAAVPYPNTLIFVDLPTPDPAASAAFYAEAFGCEVEPRPDTDFHRIVPRDEFLL